jgi:hypothetical protein
MSRAPARTGMAPPAGFYEIPQINMYYYCATIEADKAAFVLVESFQLKRLVQGQIMPEVKVYVPRL